MTSTTVMTETVINWLNDTDIAIHGIADYHSLRAYTGTATLVRITSTGIAGLFQRDDSDTTSVDNGGTVIIDVGDRRWKRMFDGAVNVLWFGALGNGTGRTPADDGVDITGEPWNRYPAGSAYFNPAYTPDPTITAATKAFTNIDSWDTIGIQLALWGSRVVLLPVGLFKLTRPLQRLWGMEGLFYGQGAYHSTIIYKDYETFGTRPSAGDALLHYYRVIGGPPSYIRDMGILSEGGSTKGTGLHMQNCNQIHLDNLWVTAFTDGILQDTLCNDGPFLSGIITEYCTNAVRSENCDIVYINNCNFWQTAGGGDTYNAVVIHGGANFAGHVRVNDTKFTGYRGAAVWADGEANVSNCDIVDHLDGIPITGGAYSQVNGNRFKGAWGSACVSLGDRALVTGNTIQSFDNQHTEILLTGTRAMATGNYVAKTGTAANADNYAIRSSGTLNFIQGNFLDGGTRATISAGGLDTVVHNVQAGVFVP